MIYVACMDKKISLDQSNQIYYFFVPSAAHQHLFSSVFAIDHFVEALSADEEIRVYGYCLFDDALHLLLYCQTKPSLWLEPFLMQYNQWHQNTSGETGYLFNDVQSRSILVQPKYLPEWLRYIHRLPVIKKQAATCNGYLYSSYHLYLSSEQHIVDTQYALSLISHHKGMRLRRFVDYMNTSQSDHLVESFEKGNRAYYHAYAEESYITKLLSGYSLSVTSHTDSNLPQIWQNCTKLLQQVTELEESALLGISRHHKMTDAHYVLAWLFIKVAKGPSYFVAKQLDQDETTIQLNVRSIELHHPASFLRYIEQRWNQIYSDTSKVAS